MKTAGMVLGIIGGAIAIICSIAIIIGMAIGGAALQSDQADQALDMLQQEIEQNSGFYSDETIPPQAQDFFRRDNFPDFARSMVGLGLGAVLAFGIIGLIGGVLGLIGGIVIKSKPVLSGVFLIIGAVCTASYCFTFILMGIAAVFAFIKQQPPASAPANP